MRLFKSNSEIPKPTKKPVYIIFYFMFIFKLFKLCTTKFKFLKSKNLYSRLSISLSFFTFLTLVIGNSGINNLINTITKDSLKGRYFVTNSQYDQVEDSTQHDDSTYNYVPEHKDNYVLNDLGYKNIFYGNTSTSIFYPDLNSEVLKTKPIQEQLITVSSKENLFMQDMVDPKYSLEDNYDGKIPVLLQDNLIFELNNTLTSPDNKANHEFLKAEKKALLGKSIKLLQSTVNPNVSQPMGEFWNTNVKPVPNVELIIVGFVYPK
jgi:hypothetical protein